MRMHDDIDSVYDKRICLNDFEWQNQQSVMHYAPCSVEGSEVPPLQYGKLTIRVLGKSISSINSDDSVVVAPCGLERQSEGQELFLALHLDLKRFVAELADRWGFDDPNLINIMKELRELGKKEAR